MIDELKTHLKRFSTHGELVFAGRDGGALYRGAFRRRVWLPTVEKAGLGSMRFHDLRHTAAGLLIEQGVHAKVLQTRLGHASISTTLDVYGHLLPGLDEAVVDGLEAAHLAAQTDLPAAHVLHGHQQETSVR